MYTILDFGLWNCKKMEYEMVSPQNKESLKG